MKGQDTECTCKPAAAAPRTISASRLRPPTRVHSGMIPLIATIVFAGGVAVLFFLDRDADVQTSKGLWIPVIWMMIVGSRSVSQWLNPNEGGDLPERFTEGHPLDAAIYGLLILAGLLILNYRSRKVEQFLRENSILLLFFGYCAVSVLWSGYPFVAFKREIKGLGTLVMALVVLTEPNPMVAMKRFFARTAFILLPLSVLFILFYPNLGTYFDAHNKLTYYFGVTTQKNSLGLTCMVCGLASLWSFLNAYEDRNMRHRTRHLIAHGAVLVMAAWLLKTCDSVTSVSCLAIAGGVMYLTTRRWVARRPRNMHLVVGGAVVLAIFALFMDTSGLLLRLLGRNATLTGRTEIWAAVLSFNTNPLVGTGYESYWLGDRIQRVSEIIGYTGVAEAHNGYLELYLNLGWVGLAMLGMLLLSGYRNALVALHSNPVAGRLRIAFFTAGVIFSLSEAGFQMMSPIWIAFLLQIVAVPPLLEPLTDERTFTLPWIQGKAPPRSRILQ